MSARSNRQAEEVVSTGVVAEGFEEVQRQFDAYLRADPHFSAQLAIRRRGELVVDLAGGPDATRDSITGVFSATKGVSAVVVATMVEDGCLDLDEPVVRYWPEFAPHGKDRILVRELLSHQAGLVNVEGGLDMREVLLDSRSAAELLAEARPVWRPGSAFGYHGLTIGVLMEELARRVTGDSLQGIYEKRVRARREIDFYLGLPESQEARYRDVLPLRLALEQVDESVAELGVADGYPALMLGSLNAPVDLVSGHLSPNRRAVRSAGTSAIGGVGSARGLADVYAAATGQLGEPLLSEDTIGQMTQQQAWGRDRVLGVDACYATVFEKSHEQLDFGSYRAFGHGGAGGAFGCADPLYDLAIGYIPAALQPPGGADPKGLHLSRVARSCMLNA